MNWTAVEERAPALYDARVLTRIDQVGPEAERPTWSPNNVGDGR